MNEHVKRDDGERHDVKRHPLIRLWHYASGYQGEIMLASLYSVLNKLFDLAPPILIGFALDVVTNQENSFLGELGIVDVSDQLWVLVALTVVAWALESAFQYLYQVRWRNLSQVLQHELRVDAYRHVQDLELAYFEDRSTGGLMAILNNDINQLERFFDIGANQILQVLTTVIVVGSLFLGAAPAIGWLTLLPMPLIIWGSIRFQKRIAPRYAAVREQVSALNSQLSNNLSGIATVKSYTAEAYEAERIREESGRYLETNRQAINLSSAFVPLIRMAIMVGFIAILLLGGRQVIAGELNVGVYSTLVFMTQRLLWPLTRLGDTLDLYQRAMASTHRALDLLQTEPEITSGPLSLPTEQVRGEVLFDDVTFIYRGDKRPVLRNLTLHVPAGQTAAIVGATGAGKSTIIKLLLRFYDVQEGQVCLDGHDLRTLQLDDLRDAIGFVSQDVYLFHGTVRENIAYGSFEATMEEIVEAARVAEAHDFIMSLPNGYDTIVGERGQKLSGGQRQRISIARAVLKDPPVLVLDEATSAVDNETEAAIQRSLERLVVDRTTIVIAHRLSTVRNANRIFVLDEGELHEQGRHEELVEANGLYAALWRVQTGERFRGNGANGSSGSRQPHPEREQPAH
ncbi:MAG: ABC transporter ATP-binding protein [Candidatus Promineifilaceae bacterium]|nr:ABC transporter ATP-binding protein [Candidatus Promineifilaceae bacterium]